ncbi:MAG: hypothetical protein FD134_2327 [Gallionellaceae bacterium]|nr:MAG: hypothetical protein FD134_2327 [Gallionellaceae bacterium]
MVGQQFGFFLAAAVFVLAENRHEGLRERAFREQSPQQVGQLEGNKESVGRHAGAEHARDQYVADKGQDA